MNQHTQQLLDSGAALADEIQGLINDINASSGDHADTGYLQSLLDNWTCARRRIERRNLAQVIVDHAGRISTDNPERIGDDLLAALNGAFAEFARESLKTAADSRIDDMQAFFAISRLYRAAFNPKPPSIDAAWPDALEEHAA